MILCDTNILIEFYKNNQSVVRELQRIGVDNVAVSAITVAELYYGALNKRELRQIKNHLALLPQLPLTSQITQAFLSLMEDYALSHKIALPDALIAATALEHGIELYTLNIRDFRYIRELSLHTPAEN